MACHFIFLLAVLLGGQLRIRFSLMKASPQAINIGAGLLVFFCGSADIGGGGGDFVIVVCFLARAKKVGVRIVIYQ